MVVIVDTGPLVALLDAGDRFHSFAVKSFSALRSAVTCEAALVEASYLLRRSAKAQRALAELVTEGTLRVPFRLESEMSAVSKLMTTHKNVPMSLADGCLVRLYELSSSASILTLDRDFLLYRAHGNKPVKTWMP